MFSADHGKQLLVLVVLPLWASVVCGQDPDRGDTAAAGRYAMKAMKLFSFEAVGELPDGPTNEELRVLRGQLGLKSFDRDALNTARGKLSATQSELVQTAFERVLEKTTVNTDTLQGRVTVILFEKIREELQLLKRGDTEASEAPLGDMPATHAVVPPSLPEGSSTMPVASTPQDAPGTSADEEELPTADAHSENTRPVLVPQVSHLTTVQQAKFSPDGKRLITISQGAVVVWDVESGRVLRRFNNDSPNSEIHWTVDAACETLLTAHYDPEGNAADKLVSLLSIRTGEQIMQFNVSFEYETTLMALAPNRKSIYIVKGAVEPKIFCLDVEALSDDPEKAKRSAKKISIPSFVNELGMFKRLVLSPNGKKIARFSSGGIVVVDVPSGDTQLRIGNAKKIVGQMNMLRGMFGAALGAPLKKTYLGCDFDHDGDHLLTVKYDDAELYDMADGRLLRRFERSREVPLSAASVSPDGSQVVLLYIDGGAEVRESTTGNLIHQFTPTEEIVPAMAEIEKSVTAGLLPRLKAIQQGRVPAEYSAAYKSMMEASMMSAGGTRLDAINPAAVQYMALYELTGYLSACYLNMPVAQFLPDGSGVLTGLPGTGALLWEIRSGKPLTHLYPQSVPMNAAAFGSDSQMMVTDNRTSGNLMRERLQLLLGPMSAGASSPGSPLSCFDLTSGRLITPIGVVPNSAQLTAWATCGSGRRLATGSKDGKLSVHNAGSGDVERTILVEHPVLEIESPSTTDLVLAKSLHHASCYDASTGQRLFEHASDEEHDEFIRSRISPDGRFVAVDSGKGKLLLFDSHSSEQLHALVYCRRPEPGQTLQRRPSNPSGEVLKAAEYEWNLWHRIKFSAGSKLIGSSADLDKLSENRSGTSKNLCVFDTTTGRKVVELDVNDTLFSFIGDEKVVYSAGERTSARIDGWFVQDVQTGQTGSLPFPDQYTQHFDWLEASPDGRCIACTDGTRLLLYDAASLKLTADTTRPELIGFGEGVCFTPDSRFIVLSSRVEGRTTFLDTHTGEEVGYLIKSPKSNDWLFATPEGLFDGSAGGRQSVCFRIGDGLNIVPVDRFFQDFYYPGLLAAIWRGERPKPDVVLGEELPPLIAIDSPQAGGNVEENRVTVTVTAKDQGGGIQGPSIKHNGARLIGAVQSTERIEDGVRRTFCVDLIQGENVLEIVSASADGSFESEPARLVLQYSKPLPKSGSTCWLSALTTIPSRHLI